MNFLVLISETTGFDGTAWSIVFRIEVENDLLSLVIVELHYITRGQERGELRSAHSCLDTGGRLHEFVKEASSLLWVSLSMRDRGPISFSLLSKPSTRPALGVTCVEQIRSENAIGTG